MKIFVLLLIIILGLFQAVYAQDIMLSTNQTEYYFRTGDNAVIPLGINNTYGKQISGILQYTMAQQINQGDIQLSNYNTEKKSLSVNEEISQLSLDLGKSDTPANFTVELNFNYNENGDRIVTLGPILIHFISDESQKNSAAAQNKMRSSSQPNTQSNQQDLFSQQQQQMEKDLKEMLNQQNPSQNQQQELQNNQLVQDSSALKQQLEKQVQRQEQIKDEFKKNLFSNNDFLTRNQKLIKNGYNISNSNLNAISNDTGSFEVKYNNTDGKWATLQGTMKNGSMTEIKEQTQDRQEKLLEKIKQNVLYKQFHNKLIAEGFSQKDIIFQANGNETSITLNYEDQEHTNAKITTNFVNDEIKQVTLEDKNPNALNLMLLVIIAAASATAITIYLVIRKLKNKKRFTIVDDSSSIKKSISPDYVMESKKLIDGAIQYHNKGEDKEAFGTAGKSIRLFLSYDAGLKREVTSEELIRLIQKNNYPLDDIRECLKITDLVEFAKLKATEDDFKKIISLFNKLSDQRNIFKT